MAKLIKTTGVELEVNPENGSDFQLKEMQDFVGGTIQIIRVDNNCIVCNDDGKLLGLPYNEKATEMYGKYLFSGDYLVGDILIIPNNQIL